MDKGILDNSGCPNLPLKVLGDLTVDFTALPVVWIPLLIISMGIHTTGRAVKSTVRSPKTFKGRFGHPELSNIPLSILRMPAPLNGYLLLIASHSVQFQAP